MTTDDGFSVPSSVNQKAVETASALALWCDCQDNLPYLAQFSRILCVRLHACFSRRHTSLKLRKEKMWRVYHRLRTSATFCKDWRVFLQSSIGHQGHPAFFQYVSLAILKHLIKVEYPLPPPDVAEHPDRPLTFEEQNALRFVAGYVCRNIHNKLETSLLPEKQEMMMCIMGLVDDEEGGDESELWLNAIDRGGLWHVNDSTYTLFAIAEEEIRRYFTTRKPSQLQESNKKEIIMHPFNHGDILFQWCLLTASTQDSAASLLLRKLIELYVTVRGYAFVTSCVEMFKQETNQSLQRKKALRKQIS